MRAETDRPAGSGDFADALATWMQLDGARHSTWLAEHGGRPVGMIWLLAAPRVPRPYLPDRWTGDIQTFWVRPEVRGRGIGRLLRDAVLAEADRRGYERVVVHSSEGAIPLYGRAGLVPDPLLLDRRHPAD